MYVLICAMRDEDGEEEEEERRMESEGACNAPGGVASVGFDEEGEGNADDIAWYR